MPLRLNSPKLGLYPTVPQNAEGRITGMGGVQTDVTELKNAEKQAREARMLLSDLLDIGMQQRKAYEEAMRKANAAKQPAIPPLAR